MIFFFKKKVRNRRSKEVGQRFSSKENIANSKFIQQSSVDKNFIQFCEKVVSSLNQTNQIDSQNREIIFHGIIVGQRKVHETISYLVHWYPEGV